jgi:hypothetical protein
MGNGRGITRLGMLAVGLGLGAAVAQTPLGSADSSIDWLSSVDTLLGGALPAPATSGLDLAISFDGYSLVSDGNATATTVAGEYGLAVAYGDESGAYAEGGFGDFALASGGASAVAGDAVPGATGNNFDFASASGLDTEALAGDSGADPDTTGSSFDFASASSGTDATGTPAYAAAGYNGSGDVASADGLGAVADAGTSTNAADPANYDSAIVLSNLTTTTSTEALVGFGGSSDNAFIIDPLGTVGSTADAGLGNNFDLAGVFGDALNATATSANYVVDILPSL